MTVQLHTFLDNFKKMTIKMNNLIKIQKKHVTTFNKLVNGHINKYSKVTLKILHQKRITLLLMTLKD